MSDNIGFAIYDAQRTLFWEQLSAVPGCLIPATVNLVVYRHRLLAMDTFANSETSIVLVVFSILVYERIRRLSLGFQI
jgi:hypothetical protein